MTAPGVPKVDYVIDLNTGVTTPLPGSIEGGRYAVSPDGSLLAYVGAADDGSPQIFIADIDGTVVHQMTHDLTKPNWPAWSPDGTMIAYEGFGKGTNPFVLDVAMGESTQITDEGGYGGPHQFTPDGSSLLYTGTDGSSLLYTGSDAVLRTVPIDGGKSTVLIGPSEGMGSAGNGSLSPDGSLVTMIGNKIGGPGAIRFVANADGTELRSIPGGVSSPAGTWAPDGAGSSARGPQGSASSSSTSRRETSRPSPKAMRRSGSTVTRCSSTPDDGSSCARAGHLPRPFCR